MSEYALPDGFLARIQQQLPETATFEQSLDEEAGTSVRYHLGKLSHSQQAPLGEPVPWNASGRYLAERPKFNQDPLYHAGLYYPMEASSMFLAHALQQITLPDDALILDLCAAPGGKTLILKDTFPENLLLSNEIDSKRVHILKENAIRWGTSNHLVIQSDAARLQKAGVTFDLIVVDAPCSGEGLFRKDKKSRTEWTPDRATGCAVRQQEILEDVLPLLSPGGWIVYSTCTFNPEENMERVQQLLDAGLESVEIPVSAEWGVDIIHGENATGYQFWLHRVRGEGFFISILKYPEDAEVCELPGMKVKSEKFQELPDLDLDDLIIEKWDGRYVALTYEELALAHALKKSGNVVKRGILLGELKGKDFIPAHDLSTHPKMWAFPNQLELTEAQALDYLRGNALSLDCPKGPVLLTYLGLGIGFGKSNGDRINNLFPKHLRIF